MQRPKGRGNWDFGNYQQQNRQRGEGDDPRAHTHTHTPTHARYLRDPQPTEDPRGKGIKHESCVL